MENKSLILLLSGNKDKIIAAHNLDESNLDIVKIDEKDLSNPKKILAILKSSNYYKLYIFTADLNYLRFLFFLFTYFLFSSIKYGSILDENKNVIKINLLTYLFKILPLFLLELFFSFFIVIASYIFIPIYKWSHSKN